MNEKSAAVEKNPVLAEKLVEAYLVERTALTDNTKFEAVTQGHLQRATQEFLETEHPLVALSNLRVRSDGTVLVNVRRDPLVEVDKDAFAAQLSSTLSNDFSFLQAQGGASLVVKFLGDTEGDIINYTPAAETTPAPAPAPTVDGETMAAVEEFLTWAYNAILKVASEPMAEQHAKDAAEVEEIKAKIAEGYDAINEIHHYRNAVMNDLATDPSPLEEMDRRLAGFVRRGSQEVPGTLAERQAAFLDAAIKVLHEGQTTRASSTVRNATESFRLIRQRAALGHDLGQLLSLVPDVLRAYGIPATEEDLPASYFAALGWVKPDASTTSSTN